MEIIKHIAINGCDRQGLIWRKCEFGRYLYAANLRRADGMAIEPSGGWQTTQKAAIANLRADVAEQMRLENICG